MIGVASATTRSQTKETALAGPVLASTRSHGSDAPVGSSRIVATVEPSAMTTLIDMKQRDVAAVSGERFKSKIGTFTVLSKYRCSILRYISAPLLSSSEG